MPPPRVVARAGGAREGRAVRRRGVLGQAGAGVRRPERTDPDPRAGAGRARRQPDGPHLHRRPQRRLPLRVVASLRAREPGHLGCPGRRSRPVRCLRHGGESLRAAGEQADPRGTRSVSALPRAGTGGARGAPGGRRARGVRMGRRAPCDRGRSARRSRRPSLVSGTRPRPPSARTCCSAASTRASRTRSRESSRPTCSTTSCVVRSRLLPEVRGRRDYARRIPTRGGSRCAPGYCSALLAFPLLVTAMGWAHAAVQPPRSSARSPVREGHDVLKGTAGSDVICGKGGADDLYGKGGDDQIYGGDGADSIFGGTGNDSAVGRHRRRLFLRRPGNRSHLGWRGTRLQPRWPGQRPLVRRA